MSEGVAIVNSVPHTSTFEYLSQNYKIPILRDNSNTTITTPSIFATGSLDGQDLCCPVCHHRVGT